MPVFIISQDWTIQNVVEQVSLTCGYPSVVVGIPQEAEAKLAELTPDAAALIVMDTGVFNEAVTNLQREVRHFLQTWKGQYPGLPIVCLGTVLQKYAVLDMQSALVPFVTKPFSPLDLMQTIQPLLPQAP